MDKETIKQFLKPDWRKLLLFFIIFSLLPIFAYQVGIFCTGGYCPPYIIEYTSLLAATAMSFIPFLSLDLSTIILLPIGMVISYLLSSWLMLKIRTLTPENRVEFKEFFKITKGKVIISVLGWITVGSVFLHFLSGIYGGTSNFPPMLSSIFGFFEIVNYVLLPFTIVTFFILFNATLGVAWLFLFLTRLRLEIATSIHPAGLTAGGGVFVILALILEWYIISCLIIFLYNKFKAKK